MPRPGASSMRALCQAWDGRALEHGGGPRWQSSGYPASLGDPEDNLNETRRYATARRSPRRASLQARSARCAARSPANGSVPGELEHRSQCVGGASSRRDARTQVIRIAAERRVPPPRFFRKSSDFSPICLRLGVWSGGRARRHRPTSSCRPFEARAKGGTACVDVVDGGRVRFRYGREARNATSGCIWDRARQPAADHPMLPPTPPQAGRGCTACDVAQPSRRSRPAFCPVSSEPRRVMRSSITGKEVKRTQQALSA